MLKRKVMILKMMQYIANLLLCWGIIVSSEAIIEKCSKPNVIPPSPFKWTIQITCDFKAPVVVQANMCIWRKLWSVEADDHAEPIEEDDIPSDHGDGGF